MISPNENSPTGDPPRRARTGPKTALGKARSAGNARRHGLSLSALADATWSDEIAALARNIAGADASAELVALARPIAQSQIDLDRVRLARHEIIATHFDDPDYPSARKVKKNLVAVTQLMKRLTKQSSKIFNRQRKLLKVASKPGQEGIDARKELDALKREKPVETSLAVLSEFGELLTFQQEGVEKFAAILADLAKKLEAIDRYERRALSRRKFAIRAFDTARAEEAIAPARPGLNTTNPTN